MIYHVNYFKERGGAGGGGGESDTNVLTKLPDMKRLNLLLHYVYKKAMMHYIQAIFVN